MREIVSVLALVVFIIFVFTGNIYILGLTVALLGLQIDMLEK